MRRPQLNNPAVIVTVSSCLIWTACVLWAPVNELNYVLRIGIAACSVAAMVRYGRAALQVYRQGARRPEDSLILGIFIASAAFLYYAGFSIFSRATGGLSMSPWSAFYPFLILLSFLLVVTATRFPNENWSALRTLAAAALTFLGFAVTTGMHFFGSRIITAVEVIFRVIPH